MRTTMLAFAGTMVFAFTIGSVSAADQLATLKGVKAVPMSSAELHAVKGMDHHFRIDTPDGVAGNFLNPPSSPKAVPLADGNRFGTDWNNDDDEANFVDITATNNAAPSYLGFKNASCNGVIVVAGFATCLP